MRFIETQGRNRGKLIINADAITFMERIASPIDRVYTVVGLIDADSVSIEETPSVVIARIKQAEEV